MKKALLLILIISFYQNHSSAQLIRNWGIKAGVVSASQDWGNFWLLKHIERAWGWDAGMFVEFLNDPHFSILAEARYIQKGFMDKEIFYLTYSSPVGKDTIITFNPGIDYLSIPVMIKFRVEIDKFAPYVILGPRIDLLIGTKSGTLSPTIDKFSKTDYGINVGGGLEYSLSSELVFGFEFQYSPSLRDVYDSDGLTVRNHSMEFLAFIAF